MIPLAIHAMMYSAIVEKMVQGLFAPAAAAS